MGGGMQQLGGLLLRLWRGALEKPPREFKEWAVSEVKQLVPFNSGAWGEGRWIEGKPFVHHVYLHNLPGDFIESWSLIQDEYTMPRDVTLHNNRTFNIDMARQYRGTDTYAGYCRKYRIEHVLGTGCANRESGLVSIMALHRSDVGHPFTERERSLIEILFPHLQETARTNWLTNLPDAFAGNQRSFHALAVCDSSGLLHFAAPSFLEMVRTEWRGWAGPFVPEKILELAPGQKYAGHAIVIGTSNMGELTSLRARARVPADKLTARELEIARHISEGRDYKAIAQDLNLSPATVKTHTNKIYVKLGINDRATLAAELRKLAL